MERMVDKARELGAYRAAVVPVPDIVLDASFRELCRNNMCGNYGKCWMCPPDVGEIDTLMERFGSFDWALVYQTVTSLEDSYDFEGMMAAAEKHARLTEALMTVYPRESFAKVWHLGAGGCHVCPVCAKREEQPCRYPERAVPSLEACGVNVSALAAAAGMNYINGTDTVTYFGAVLFSL